MRTQYLVPVFRSHVVSVGTALTIICSGSCSTSETYASAVYPRVALPSCTRVIHNGDDLALNLDVLRRLPGTFVLDGRGTW